MIMNQVVCGSRVILLAVLTVFFMLATGRDALAFQKHVLDSQEANASYKNDGDIHIYDFPYKAVKEDVKTTSPQLGMWLTAIQQKNLPKGIQQRFFHITATAREAALTSLSLPDKIEPNSPLSLLVKARSAYDAYSIEASLKLYTEFINKYPDHPLTPYAMFYAGQCLCLLHKYDDSISMHKLLIKKFSDTPWAGESLYRIACVTAGHLGKIAEGENLFEQIVKLYPNKLVAADAIFMVAAINIAKGNYEQARKQMQIILEKFPNCDRATPAAECIKNFDILTAKEGK